MRQDPFTTERPVGQQANTKVFDRSTGRPPLRKTVRVAGQDHEEVVTPPEEEDFASWVGDVDVAPSGMSGFGSFLQDKGVSPEDWVEQPEGFVTREQDHTDDRIQVFTTGPTPLEARRLKEAHRVSTDPSGVPDNFSMIDRDPQDKAFFGEDKPDELAQVRERMEGAERAVEHPDYNEGQRPPKPKFSARPLKWLVKE